MYQFNIYQRSDTFFPSRNLVVYSISSVCFLVAVMYLFIFGEKNVPTFINILLYISIFLPFVGKLPRLLNENNHKPLNGNLDGRITFDFDRIVINSMELTLSTIKKIEFSCYDYKGLSFKTLGWNFDLNNPLSNGIDNTISIIMNDNTEHVYHFQQLYDLEIRNTSEILINYYVLGKLHFLNLIDTLGYRDYEDIQKFKETLPKV